MSHLRLAPPPHEAPKPTSPVGVVLADDHAGIRHSLRTLLEAEAGIDVLAEAEDLAVAIKKLEELKPRVLVLDLHTAGGSTADALSMLRERAPDTDVVVVTMEAGPGFAHSAITAGAVGFVLKEHADSELVPAIHYAVSGSQYVSPRVAEQPARMRSSMDTGGLSERESEVLRLIALGHTSVETAAKLRLSPRTVESHRARIHSKLGLATRAELVQYALGRGLLGE
jgi:two-component system response regulator NreC